LLKLAIGKARYGVPPVTVSTEEQYRMNQLQMENEELKTEVRAMELRILVTRA
jgi:hypothetical protein